ncbi:MAG: hypothetical protein JXR37_09500 [Kiritimatiellae bacterium]|nr:hypothetical protein [Kiritimatiellia bacterium]
MPAGDLLLGIDIGTSSVKACLFRPDGTLLGEGRAPYPVERPHPGWAQVDPDVWWRAFCAALSAAARAVHTPLSAVRGVGLSMLFPAVIPLDERGQALGPGILYCDQRSTEQVACLRATGAAEPLERRTSNRLVPGTFALTSLLWLRDHNRAVYDDAAWFGTVTTLFAMRLTGTACIDYVSGLLFGLCDAADQTAWCDELVRLAEVDPRKLPRLAAPAAAIGEVTREAAAATGLPPGIPVAAGAGDVAAACFGGGCVEPGTLLHTTGSSDCISFVTGTPQTSRLFANTGYIEPDRWLSVATATSTGTAVDWFSREFLGAASGAAVAREAAKSTIGAGGITFLPYLQGERTPIWNPEAKGVFSGLSVSSSRADMARAVLEGTAFAVRQLAQTAEEHGGVTIRALPAAGGGTRNELWNRIKADVTGRPFFLFDFQEFSALGAAMLAGTAAGVYASVSDAVAATALVRGGRTVEPDAAAHAAYEPHYRRYEALYPAIRETMGGEP